MTFKVSAVKQGGGKLCIVPVRLKHQTWTDKEIEAYALLGESGDGTFMSECVFSILEEHVKWKERQL